MASVSFTCPNCAKVLRTSKRPADGKKIKCPGCDEIFVPELDGEDVAQETAVEERPRPTVKAAAKKKDADDDEDEKPRGKKASRKVEDDDADSEEDEKPRRKKTSAKDEVDEDEDEKPRRKKARARDDDEIEDDSDDGLSRKKKGKKKNAGGLMVTLLIVFGATFAVVGCVAFGVGAWVWPGFLISATNNNDLNAFIPVASTSLLGIDPAALSQKNELDPAINFIDGWRAKPDTQLPEEVRELMRNSEKVVVCTQPMGMAFVDVVAILAKDAAAVEKFKAALGPQERLEKRHIVYKPKGKRGWPVHVAVPGNRLVLLTDHGEAPLLEILKRGEKPEGDESAAVPFRKAVDQNPLWCAFAFNESTRVKFRAQFGLLALAPGMKEPVEAVARAKGGSWTADRTGPDKWKVRFNLECASEADATAIKTGGGVFKGLSMLDPSVPPAVATDINTMTFVNQGSTMNLNMDVTQKSLTAISDLQKKRLGK